MRCTLLVVGLLWAPVLAQPAARSPHVGYIYPAGGQCGTTVEVLVGGQFLRGADGVHVSGPGVRVAVLQHFPPMRNLDKDQRDALQKYMRELIQTQSRAAAPPPAPRPANKRGERVGARAARRDQSRPTPPAQSRPSGLPEHPILLNLEKKNLAELLYVRDQLLNFRKRQPAPQLAEAVLLGVTIDPKAAPGSREIRLRTPAGLTNPLRFDVGILPETSESEPNDPGASPPARPEPLDLPILVNGQVTPGDVDRLAFRATRGQRLVVEATARKLMPYLADAVPGWFQATLTLYDASGREVAFADDYRHDPDPVLFYEVPEDGTYAIEIRDAIHRGREDFVYRLSISEQPFISELFPLGTRLGAPATALIDGWNLPATELRLLGPPGPERIRQTALGGRNERSNEVSYDIGMMPESMEAEPNNELDEVPTTELPRMLNGRIDKPGDVDVVRFAGKTGMEIVAEIRARRLQSPLDSVLRLLDPSGTVIAWNDDTTDKEAGLLTHHADSYVHARLPSDGTYAIEVSDAQHRGGSEFAYRLRVSRPWPDFAVRVTPSTVNVRPGWAVPLCVHVMRRDGFTGPIDVALKDGHGFTLSGARVPPGLDRVRMTLNAPRWGLKAPVDLHLEATAQISGRTVRRAVVPAEDMMQAFAYQHLAPAQEFVAWTPGPQRAGPAIEVSPVTLRLPAGGTAELRVTTPRGPMSAAIKAELVEPPSGVSLGATRVTSDGVAIELKADAEKTNAGSVDNLIIEVFSEMSGQSAQARKPQQRSIGVLPAIALEIVNR